MTVRPRSMKRALQALVMAALLCLGTLGLLGQVAKALADASERDVTYRYFDEALSRMDVEASAVTWPMGGALRVANKTPSEYSGPVWAGRVPEAPPGVPGPFVQHAPSESREGARAPEFAGGSR